MSCSICYDDMCKESKNFVRLECKHEFHFSCIFQLMSTNTSYNNNCPMCREKIVDSDQLKVRNINDQLEFQEMWNLIRRFETRNRELWWQSTVYFWTSFIMVLFFLGLSLWIYTYTPKTSIFLSERRVIMMSIIDEYILLLVNGFLGVLYYMVIPFYYIGMYVVKMIFNQYVLSTIVLGVFTMLSSGYGPVMLR